MSNGKDDLRARFESAVGEDERDNEQATSDEGDAGDAGNKDNTGDRKNVKNYPFYIPEDLREELDQLYNQYDGKNKVEGGDGIEKHAEFMEPVMRAAIEELDLDEIVPYEPDK